MNKEEKEAKAVADAQKNNLGIEPEKEVELTNQSKEIAELIEEKRVLASKLDEKTQQLQAKDNDLTTAIQESQKQSEIIEKLMDQIGKPVDSTKASVEIEGVVFVVTEENKTVKSIYHGAVPVKIENFTAEMVAEYVESGLLEEQ